MQATISSFIDLAAKRHGACFCRKAGLRHTYLHFIEEAASMHGLLHSLTHTPHTHAIGMLRVQEGRPQAHIPDHQVPPVVSTHSPFCRQAQAGRPQAHIPCTPSVGCVIAQPLAHTYIHTNTLQKHIVHTQPTCPLPLSSAG